MAANKKDICVIGTGRFGTAVIEQLVDMQRYVLALDLDEKYLLPISRIANQVAVADGSDIEALKGLGLQKFSIVIVAVSDNIEIIAALLELGVKHIIAKAKSIRHQRVLEQIGVDVIIRPEAEAGTRAAIIATNPSFIKYSESLQEIGDGYAIGSTMVKNSVWTNKPLKELNFKKFKISIISIKSNSKVVVPDAESKLLFEDTVTLIGKIQNITKIFSELNDMKVTKEVKIDKINKAKSQAQNH